MDVKTAEKAKSILEDLMEYREFLKEYDECYHMVITVKESFLSSLKSTLDFSNDAHLKKVIRDHIVSKIEDLEKQLKELDDSSQTNLQGACKVVSDELHKHGEFYNAFVASVQSVITEAPEESWSNELAEQIVKRIFGEK